MVLKVRCWLLDTTVSLRVYADTEDSVTAPLEQRLHGFCFFA